MKWPAPDAPTCAQPFSGASPSNTGASRFTGALSPPTIRQNPTSSPQIPPETPTSTKAIFRLRASL